MLPIGLADLADALRHLKPDAEALRAIAHALGIRAIAARPRDDAQPPILPDFDRPPDEWKEPPRESETASQSRRSARGLRVELVKSAGRRDSIPAAVRRAKPLAISDEMLHSAPAPLLRPQQAGTFLQDHAGQFVPMPAIDVDAAIEQLARLRLFALPREHRKGFRQGVSVVFDESPGMEPFRDDVEQLRDAVQRFAGPHVIATCDVSRSPDECDVADLARAGTVLLITDLGLGRLRGTQRSWTEDWVDLSKRLARAGRRVVAIVPYGPKRWPQRTEIEITHWNDSTAPQTRDSTAEVEELARALSIAGRIDPALVRSARRILFPSFDPGVEGDFLFSPLLEVSTSRAVVFHDEELHRLRDEIAKRPSELESARRFLAAYRKTVGPKSVALEEDIVYFALRQSRGDRKEIEQRIASIVRTMLDRADDFDLARWASGVYAELPAWARELKLSESLEQAASVRLGRPLARVKSWLLPSESMVAGIERDGDSLIIREPRQTGDAEITVPSTNPRVVIAGDEIMQFGEGQPGRIAAPSLPLELETLDGARFRVTAAPRRTLAPGIEWIDSFGGSAGPVNAIAFDPSGRLFATANDNGQVELFNIETSKFVGSLHGHSGRVHCVAFDRKGDVLASGASDGKILFRETRSGKFHRDLLGRHDGEVLSLAFDDDGHLASGGSDETIRIWSTKFADGPDLTLEIHQGPVQTVVFAGRGSLLGSGSSDGTVKVTEGVLQRTVLSLTGSSPAVAFSPDGELLATATLSGAIRILEAATGKKASELEGHVAQIVMLSFSHDGRFLASLDAAGELRIWDCATGACLAVIASSSTQRVVAFHSTRNELATVGIGPDSDPSRVDLWTIDRDRLSGPAPPRATRHTEAKIVLLGDTGVGKSGLAQRLTSGRFELTESTHGRNVWLLDSKETVEGDSKVVREAMLWDLAGQPAYQLLHQLDLDDVVVALVVFDARSETDPFASVRHWSRALRQANRNRRAKKFLIAGRMDRGGVGLGRSRLDTLMRELEFDGFFETSAKTGAGVSELREAILEAIPWDELVWTSMPESIGRIRSFVMSLKERGRPMVNRAQLLDEYRRTKAEADAPDLPQIFDGSLDLLQARGLVRRLPFGDLVLLQPAVLNDYASAIVLEARHHPDGLGAVAEANIFDGQILRYVDNRLDPEDERLLLHAAIEELVRRDLAAWEVTAGGRFLVFPSQVQRDYGAEPKAQRVTLTIRFSGWVETIQATLMVRLSHTSAFTLDTLWRNAATFRDPTGGQCGLMLRDSDGERATLLVFFDERVRPETRALFEEFVVAHLRARATEVEVTRSVICANCGTRMPDEYVALRRTRGFAHAECPTCGSSVPLDVPETASRSSSLEKLDRSADRESAFDAFTIAAVGALRAPEFRRWEGAPRSRASLGFVIAEFEADAVSSVLSALKREDGFEVTSGGRWMLAAFPTSGNALRFALAINEASRARAAVHTGSLIEADRNPEVINVLVNFTARLLRATENAITVSDRVKQQLGDIGETLSNDIEWIARHDVVLKGFAVERTVWSIAPRITIRTRIGFGRADDLVIRGHVIADRDRGTYVQRHGVPGARVTATYGRAAGESQTDETGAFLIRLAPRDISRKELWHEVPIEMAHRVRRLAQAMVPPRGAQFGVIVDIDETIIQTSVTGSVRAASAPFTGLGTFCRRLQRNVNPIFYLSGSSQDLEEALLEMLEARQIPVGPFLLRDRQPADEPYKLEQVQMLLDYYPELPFVLIGSTRQRVPEIFVRVIGSRPGRIHAAFLHGTAREPRKSAVWKMIDRAKAAGVEVLIVRDSDEALKHLERLGLA